MRTFKMIKTSLKGQYVTEKAVIPNSGDIIKLVYPDGESIIVRFESSRIRMSCSECPLRKYLGGLVGTCTALRTTRSGNHYHICEVRSSGIDSRWCRISKVSDVLEEL